MSDVNVNVDDYTVDELLDILGITDFSEDEVVEKTNFFKDKFEKENNPEMVQFFQDIQDNLLEGEQSTEWYKNEYLTQNDQEQKNKITQRTNKVQLFDNNHFPMNREQLGVSNNYQVKVGQDTLNPVLQNTISRYIVIDSKYRQGMTGDGSELNTDFTIDLSERLINVLSIRLTSTQIPFSWFNITDSNNLLQVFNQDVFFNITIETGYYETIDDIITAINNSFINTGFLPNNHTFISIVNGKVSIFLNGCQDPHGQIISFYGNTTQESGSIYFYTNNDIEPITNSCGINKQRTGIDYQNTLGWLLGYRDIAEYIYENGNPASGLYKIYPINYFILVIDDFNQNHINNGIVTITELSTRIPTEKYNTSDNPYYCQRPTPFTQADILNASLLNNTSASVIADKIIPPYNNIVHILPSAPRTLTQSQIYSSNEINKNNSKTTRYKPSAPNNSDTFAILPLSTRGITFGSIITETGSTLQLNQRTYFGPVNIDRLRIRLLDDKGNTVDLNGVDWNFVLIADCLYQY